MNREAFSPKHDILRSYDSDPSTAYQLTASELQPTSAMADLFH